MHNDFLWAASLCIFVLLLGIAARVHAQDPGICMENDVFSVTVSPTTGAITSLKVKETGVEMINENRLAANFRINLPLPDYQCHYIDGMAQQAKVTRNKNIITVSVPEMKTEHGAFPIQLVYTITLDKDALRFHSTLANKTSFPVAEFWFPRFGGWTCFDTARNAALASPGYTGCAHSTSLFRWYPGFRGLGAEASEFSTSYPGMVMPWWDIYDPQTDLGLYLGYHDETFRMSTWHTYLYPNSGGGASGPWMTPEQANGEPVGLVFSHVRYPYIKDNETLDSGEFILRLHRGDWHRGAQCYGKWFREHFPVPSEASWLRKQSAWFTSIIYQPEDRIIADFNQYGEWCRKAQELADIHCFELIGWHRGGIERGYPDYIPEEKLGGQEAFRKLLHDIDARGGKCLAFANYNVMDSASDWYKQELQPLTHQDRFGKTPNWMAWGESTLTARLGLNVRRHVLASAVPAFNKILEERFVNVAKDGAHGLQLDKVVAGSMLDFNPLNTLKPDTALCEGLVQSMKSLYDKCRAIRPDFCFASEASQDRLIPFVDVFYRNASGYDIAPLRFVFPEWTACQHVAAPREFGAVNSAVLTGAVICMEPNSYQDSLANPLFKDMAKYIKEVNRLRTELADTIFLGDYYDKLGAEIYQQAPNFNKESPQYVHPSNLVYRVHGNRKTGQRAIVVANPSGESAMYQWQFVMADIKEAMLYEPFQATRNVLANEPITIPAEHVQILVAKPDPRPESLYLRMRCGDSGYEFPVAHEGYAARVEKGEVSAWGPKWVLPVYHCRTSETEVAIKLTVPQKTKGCLRLFAIDPDSFYGGRKQEIVVNGKSSGIMENFVEGRWIEVPMTEHDTENGKVFIQIFNRLGKGNCVLSYIEWLKQ